MSWHGPASHDSLSHHRAESRANPTHSSPRRHPLALNPTKARLSRAPTTQGEVRPSPTPRCWRPAGLTRRKNPSAMSFW